MVNKDWDGLRELLCGAPMERAAIISFRSFALFQQVFEAIIRLIFTAAGVNRIGFARELQFRRNWHAHYSVYLLSRLLTKESKDLDPDLVHGPDNGPESFRQKAEAHCVADVERLMRELGSVLGASTVQKHRHVCSPGYCRPTNMKKFKEQLALGVPCKVGCPHELRPTTGLFFPLMCAVVLFHCPLPRD